MRWCSQYSLRPTTNNATPDDRNNHEGRGDNQNVGNHDSFVRFTRCETTFDEAPGTMVTP
ncbi:unannotated protein [freshwater metagenome]|uniref:Unannotated protein n=1 Tax=freshwater metagenome TaxID=449393 RepID=A0A6J6WJS6_9ZZZZ